jgi:Raf kinase inhibitor-like YbhB/YbcL family protein
MKSSAKINSQRSIMQRSFKNYNTLTLKIIVGCVSFLFTLFIIIAMTSFTNEIKLSVTSTSFTNNGLIPAKYSCEGEEISPPLKITDIPPGAKSLALTVHDPDAPAKGGFTHWVVWNIDTNGNIPENFKNAEQGMNGSNKAGYKGMCPPSGTHHYHFKVYALNTRLTIERNTDKSGLEKAMRTHIMAEGELVGLYAKTKR